MAQAAVAACDARIARCAEQINALLATIDQLDAAITANDASITQLHDTAGASYQEIQAALAQLEADLDAALAAAPAPPVNPNPPPGPPGPGGNGVNPLVPPVPGDAGGGPETPVTPGDNGFVTPRQGPVPANAMVNMGGIQIELRDALHQIGEKARQMSGRGQRDNKYSQALERIKQAQTEAEINQILSSSGFKFNQQTRALQGGKTRKARKGKKSGKKSRKGKKAKKTQRGGYRAVYRRRYSRKTTSSA